VVPLEEAVGVARGAGIAIKTGGSSFASSNYYLPLLGRVSAVNGNCDVVGPQRNMWRSVQRRTPRRSTRTHSAALQSELIHTSGQPQICLRGHVIQGQLLTTHVAQTFSSCSNSSMEEITTSLDLERMETLAM